MIIRPKTKNNKKLIIKSLGFSKNRFFFEIAQQRVNWGDFSQNE